MNQKMEVHEQLAVYQVDKYVILQAHMYAQYNCKPTITKSTLGSLLMGGMC